QDGRAALILGDSGVGKTTLVFGALRAGWDVLSDDLVLIRPGSAAPEMAGIPKALLAPAEVVSDDVPSWPLLNDPRSRRHVQFEDWDRSWRPVTRIVVIDHGTEEHAMLEPLERPELLGLLMHGMLCRQRRSRQGYVELAMRLCALPAYRLRHAQAADDRARQAADALAGM